MTNKEWKEEVERAVVGAGLPWRVFAAWMGQNSATCCADLTDTRTGKERSITLAPDRFPTVAERRGEILRQLSTS